MIGSKCLRVAASLVLIAGCYALHLRDVWAQVQPLEPQFRIEVLPSAAGMTALCQFDVNGKLVSEEALGYNGSGQLVCEAIAIVTSGSSISAACPLGVATHQAVINSRAPGSLSIISQYGVSTSASWPTAPGTYTPSGMAVALPPGCPEVHATSRGIWLN
jgi:hypothetical protein